MKIIPPLLIQMGLSFANRSTSLEDNPQVLKPLVSSIFKLYHYKNEIKATEIQRHLNITD